MLDDPKRAESNSAGVAPQERRASPRYAFSAAAEAVHLQTDTRLNGRISDLGRGGCYVDTINPFPVGADVKIRITKDNSSLVAQARVLYSSGGMGMGLMFTKIEPERLPVLEKWLAELRGEISPEAEALERDEPEQIEESVNGEQRYVLNELIIALMRKRVLTDAEGKAMLQKLLE
jgi:PilZ domain-containing protein